MKTAKFPDAKILICDEEFSNVQVLKRILIRSGFTNVFSTIKPDECLDIYRKEKPDILLLSLGIPEMDGFMILEELKNIQEDDYLPVLILTVQGDRETLLQALESGAKDFLYKPFDLAEILMRINNIIEGRLLHNRIRNQNKVLEEKVQERTHALRETRMEVIHRLGRASEYRDNETGMHIIRMSRLSARLAQAIGMSGPECELILNASPMHDVGKIGIPDSILLKPGKLTDQEYEIMKLHPRIGAEILSGSQSDLLQMAEMISLTHQERWDGSGYPCGLQGEEIPLIGRIVALCDVFDALMSKRPYKRAFTVEESMAIIEEKSGKDFDPKLVEVFKTVLPDMLDIIKECVDSRHKESGKSKLEEIFAMLQQAEFENP